MFKFKCGTSDKSDILSVLQAKLVDKGIDKCSIMFSKYYNSLYNYRLCNIYIQGLRVFDTIEMLKCEIKRSTKKIYVLPLEDSAMRSEGLIMMDINEEYVTGRMYINEQESNNQ